MKTIEPDGESLRRNMELLITMIRRHAQAVDGLDRKQLNDIAARLNYWRGVVEGEDLAVERWREVVGAVAGAGCSALQILGGRLARNEGWGDARDDDEDRRIDDDLGAPWQ